MAKIIWSAPTRFDLEMILATIAREVGQHVARKWSQRISRAIAQLALFPEIGSEVEVFPFRNFREQIVGPYRIIYRFDGVNCRLLAIVRAQQDLTRRLNTEDDFI